MEKNKNLNKGVIVNIVLFVGLIALYAVHFIGTSPDPDESVLTDRASTVERQIAEATHALAYVDNDILMDNYLMAIALSAEFEAEQRRLENDMDRRQRNFQIEVERFQRDVQRGHVTMEEAQVLEQELMIQQQDLMQLNETYRERLARKEFEMNSELLDNIREFLDRYNEAHGFDFILGYARGGGILHANKAYDITQEVLEQLNKEYEERY